MPLLSTEKTNPKEKQEMEKQQIIWNARKIGTQSKYGFAKLNYAAEHVPKT